MTITLVNLISRVRLALADVPTDMLTNDQISENLTKADHYIDNIIVTGVLEDYQKSCIVNLATYYTYLSYTSLAERQLGNVPTTSVIRLQALKEIALAFLQPVSKYTLNPDLTINTAVFDKTRGLAFMMTPTYLEE